MRKIGDKMKKGNRLLILLLVTTISLSSLGMLVLKTQASGEFHSQLRLNEILIQKIEITDRFSGGSGDTYNIYYGIKTERHFDNFGDILMSNNDYEDALSSEGDAESPDFYYYGSVKGNQLKTITNPITIYSYGKEFGSVYSGNELQIFIKVTKGASTQIKHNSFGDNENEYTYYWSSEYDYDSPFDGSLKVKYLVDVITTNNQDYYYYGMDKPLQLHKVQILMTKIEVTDELGGSSYYRLSVGYKWRRHFGEDWRLRFTDDDNYEDNANYPDFEEAISDLSKEKGVYTVNHYGAYSYAEPLGIEEEDGQFQMFIKLERLSNPIIAAEIQYKTLGDYGQYYDSEYSTPEFSFVSELGGIIKIYFKILRL
jgi:hypothetical protein